MNQQDIVWIKIPYSDFSKEKIRPAVIVSNKGYNSTHGDVIICSVTSRLDLKDYYIRISQRNLMEGTLSIESSIRADKIMPIEKTLILKKFARLNDKTYNKVIEEILKLITKSK